MKKQNIVAKTVLFIMMLACISIFACACGSRVGGHSITGEISSALNPEIPQKEDVNAEMGNLPAGEKVYLPVLIYHHFNEEASAEGATTTIGSFRAQMAAMKEAGYQTVTLDELIAFVECRGTLPEKPLLITMDDGNQSTLTLAAPVLEEVGYSVVLFSIGSKVGHPNFGYAGKPFNPEQFSWREARVWAEKGVVDIQSHTYNMHNYIHESFASRDGVLMAEGESEEDYRLALRVDYSRSKADIEGNIGNKMVALAFPFGYYSDIALEEAKNMGVKITFAADHGGNYVVSGDPESLHLLLRISGFDQVSGKDLVRQLELAQDALHSEKSKTEE